MLTSIKEYALEFTAIVDGYRIIIWKSKHRPDYIWEIQTPDDEYIEGRYAYPDLPLALEGASKKIKQLP